MYLINEDLDNKSIYNIYDADYNLSYEVSNQQGVFLFLYTESYVKLIEKSEYSYLNCDSNNYAMYECKNNNCEKATGYARCGSQVLNCSGNCSIEESSESECNEDSYDKAFIDYFGLKICIKNGRGYKFRDIPSNESVHIFTYYTKSTSSYLKLYKSYQDGNILHLSTSSMFFYYFLNNLK